MSSLYGVTPNNDNHMFRNKNMFFCKYIIIIIFVNISNTVPEKWNHSWSEHRCCCHWAERPLKAGQSFPSWNPGDYIHDMAQHINVVIYVQASQTLIHRWPVTEFHRSRCSRVDRSRSTAVFIYLFLTSLNSLLLLSPGV